MEKEMFLDRERRPLGIFVDQNVQRQKGRKKVDEADPGRLNEVLFSFVVRPSLHDLCERRLPQSNSEMNESTNTESSVRRSVLLTARRGGGTALGVSVRRHFEERRRRRRRLRRRRRRHHHQHHVQDDLSAAAAETAQSATSHLLLLLSVVSDAFKFSFSRCRCFIHSRFLSLSLSLSRAFAFSPLKRFSARGRTLRTVHLAKFPHRSRYKSSE